MGPPTGGMMEGLLVSNSPLLGDFPDPPLATIQSTPFSGQFRRQCMHFGNSAGNFGGSAVRRPVGHDSAAAMSKLVALLPNYMQIVQNWSKKGVNFNFRKGKRSKRTRSVEQGTF